MNPAFDLFLLPVFSTSPANGLWAALPPARAARRRGQERLFLHLVLQGNAPLSATQQEQVFQRLAQVFYSTDGTASGAMRAAAQALNGWLLRRNRKLAQNAQQSVGLLTMGVLRPGTLYLGMCGPVHLLAATADGEVHWPPSELNGRGLGIQRLPAVRYQHLTLHEDDTLLFTPHLAPGWRPANLRGQPLPAVQVALRHSADADPNALLVRVAQGTGNLRIAVEHPADDKKETTRPGDSPEKPDESPPPQETDALTGDHVAPEETTPEGAPVPAASQRAVPPKKAPRRLRLPRLPRPNLAPLLLALWDGLGRALRNTRQALGILLGRLLPADQQVALPSSLMAFMAVAVPLVVVAVASTVYFQQGKDDIYLAYFQQAQGYAAQAEIADNETARRAAWQSALDALERAERYAVTDESQALRRTLQHNLDEDDGVLRLDFQPAIYGGLSRQIVVRVIVPYDDDLYLLDGRSGAVVRAQLTSRGYQVDASFRCGPTPRVGPLIDIEPLPHGNPLGAVIVGMDLDGNLLYCIPGQSALETVLPSPSGTWGIPRALDLYAGNLYLLDPYPRANAVWVYPGDNASFRALPESFFGLQVPTLSTAIDLARTPDDLYLLHEDGHLTRCSNWQGENEPYCEDPVLLRDDRPGRGQTAMLEDAHFAALQYVSPPDPALYFLDDSQNAVYLFSLQLRFLRQYRAANPLPEHKATAFAVQNTTRRLFLALENEVFVAVMP